MLKLGKFVLVSSVFVGFLCAGCSSLDKKTPPEEKQIQSESITTTPGLKNCTSYHDAGVKMIESIVTGLNTNNYNLYCRDFSNKFKEYFSKDIFENANKAVKANIGDFNNVQYVGDWVKGDFHVMLWKAKCTKTKDDILIEMYLKQINGEYKIEGLKLI